MDAIRIEFACQGRSHLGINRHIRLKYFSHTFPGSSVFFRVYRKGYAESRTLSGSFIHQQSLRVTIQLVR